MHEELEKNKKISKDSTSSRDASTIRDISNSGDAIIFGHASNREVNISCDASNSVDVSKARKPVTSGNRNRYQIFSKVGTGTGTAIRFHNIAANYRYSAVQVHTVYGTSG